MIHAALDMGINFIDTADIYQGGRSEEAIGAAIKGQRERVLIASKVHYEMPPGGPNDAGASRAHILDAIDASLRRLDCDYLDLYQVHRWDADTPLEETMQALDDLVRWGKVRYIGASNFSAWQLTEANALARAHGWTEFVSMQPHYHMLARDIEAEIIPACQYFNIGILPYFPLAGGFLTGKYEKGKSAPEGSRGENNAYVQKWMKEGDYDVLDKLDRFAKVQGHALNELAIAWLLAQPQISSVISGATRVEHVEANLKAIEWELSTEELQAVREILNGGGKD
ncbi:MAG TPA: aldo/keto reductase [Anaerolineales bacterium]